MAKRRLHEKNLLVELRNSFLNLWPNCLYHKIKDDPIYSESKTRFSPKRPFDSFVAYRNRTVKKTLAIEAKSHHSSESWSIDKVEDHQVEGLKQAQDNGWISFVILNVRFGRGNSRYNRCYLIDIDSLIALRKQRKKSLKLQELEEQFPNITWIKIEKLNKYFWDVIKLWNMI